MIRTIGSYLDQRTIQLIEGLQVRRFKAHIVDVLFPSRSFIVIANGYSGPSEVPADPSIPFGTLSRPLVFRGNDVWVEQDNTGRWHATQYIATNRCVPTTNPNAPNIPLPVYTPPKDTDSYEFGKLNPVDMTFKPTSFSMGQFTPLSKMPPSTSSSAYDIGDGFNGSVAANTIKNLLYFTTVRTFKIVGITAYSTSSGFAISIFANAGTYPDILISRFSSGKWQWEVIDPSTGNIIDHWDGTSVSTSMAQTLTTTVSVPVGVFSTKITTGSTAVTSFGYGLKGQLT